MIITKTGKTPADKPLKTLEIDNGDLEALNEVMEQYGFINEQAMLRYCLVALLQSSDNKLYIKQDGNIAAINVADSLIKKKTAPPTGEQ